MGFALFNSAVICGTVLPRNVNYQILFRQVDLSTNAELLDSSRSGPQNLSQIHRGNISQARAKLVAHGGRGIADLNLVDTTKDSKLAS